MSHFPNKPKRGEKILKSLYDSIVEIIDYLPSLEVRGDQQSTFVTKSGGGTVIHANTKANKINEPGEKYFAGSGITFTSGNFINNALSGDGSTIEIVDNVISCIIDVPSGGGGDYYYTDNYSLSCMTGNVFYVKDVLPFLTGAGGVGVYRYGSAPGIQGRDPDITDDQDIWSRAYGTVISSYYYVGGEGISVTPVDNTYNCEIALTATIPTSTSQLTNDSRFITIDDVPPGSVYQPDNYTLEVSGASNNIFYVNNITGLLTGAGGVGVYCYGTDFDGRVLAGISSRYYYGGEGISVTDDEFGYGSKIELTATIPDPIEYTGGTGISVNNTTHVISLTSEIPGQKTYYGDSVYNTILLSGTNNDHFYVNSISGLLTGAGGSEVYNYGTDEAGRNIIAVSSYYYVGGEGISVTPVGNGSYQAEIALTATIPSATSELVNDSHFITINDVPPGSVYEPDNYTLSVSGASNNIFYVNDVYCLLTGAGGTNTYDYGTDADGRKITGISSYFYVGGNGISVTPVGNGSYNAEIALTATIPSATSELVNDSHFITINDVPPGSVYQPDNYTLSVSGASNNIFYVNDIYCLLTGAGGTNTYDYGTDADGRKITGISSYYYYGDEGISVTPDGNGSYNAKIALTATIPSATSQLTNDSHFITINDVPPGSVYEPDNYTLSVSGASNNIFYVNNITGLLTGAGGVGVYHYGTDADGREIAGISSRYYYGGEGIAITDDELGYGSKVELTATIPSATSELVNDSHFITINDVPPGSVYQPDNYTLSVSGASNNIFYVNNITGLLTGAGGVGVYHYGTDADGREIAGISSRYYYGGEGIAITDDELGYGSKVELTATIPSATSQLTNDSHFITINDVPPGSVYEPDNYTLAASGASNNIFYVNCITGLLTGAGGTEVYYYGTDADGRVLAAISSNQYIGGKGIGISGEEGSYVKSIYVNEDYVTSTWVDDNFISGGSTGTHMQYNSQIKRLNCTLTGGTNIEIDELDRINCLLTGTSQLTNDAHFITINDVPPGSVYQPDNYTLSVSGASNNIFYVNDVYCLLTGAGGVQTYDYGTDVGGRKITGISSLYYTAGEGISITPVGNGSYNAEIALTATIPDPIIYTGGTGISVNANTHVISLTADIPGQKTYYGDSVSNTIKLSGTSNDHFYVNDVYCLLTGAGGTEIYNYGTDQYNRNITGISSLIYYGGEGISITPDGNGSYRAKVELTADIPDPIIYTGGTGISVNANTHVISLTADIPGQKTYYGDSVYNSIKLSGTSSDHFYVNNVVGLLTGAGGTEVYNYGTDEAGRQLAGISSLQYYGANGIYITPEGNGSYRAGVGLSSAYLNDLNVITGHANNHNKVLSSDNSGNLSWQTNTAGTTIPTPLANTVLSATAGGQMQWAAIPGGGGGGGGGTSGPNWPKYENLCSGANQVYVQQWYTVTNGGWLRISTPDEGNCGGIYIDAHRAQGSDIGQNYIGLGVHTTYLIPIPPGSSFFITFAPNDSTVCYFDNAGSAGSYNINPPPFDPENDPVNQLKEYRLSAEAEASDAEWYKNRAYDEAEENKSNYNDWYNNPDYYDKESKAWYTKNWNDAKSYAADAAAASGLAANAATAARAQYNILANTYDGDILEYWLRQVSKAESAADNALEYAQEAVEEVAKAKEYLDLAYPS